MKDPCLPMVLLSSIRLKVWKLDHFVPSPFGWNITEHYVKPPQSKPIQRLICSSKVLTSLHMYIIEHSLCKPPYYFGLEMFMRKREADHSIGLQRCYIFIKILVLNIFYASDWNSENTGKLLFHMTDEGVCFWCVIHVNAMFALCLGPGTSFP